jgi:hypothetical protein
VLEIHDGLCLVSSTPGRHKWGLDRQTEIHQRLGTLHFECYLNLGLGAGTDRLLPDFALLGTDRLGTNLFAGSDRLGMSLSVDSDCLGNILLVDFEFLGTHQFVDSDRLGTRLFVDFDLLGKRLFADFDLGTHQSVDFDLGTAQVGTVRWTAAGFATDTGLTSQTAVGFVVETDCPGWGSLIGIDLVIDSGSLHNLAAGEVGRLDQGWGLGSFLGGSCWRSFRSEADIRTGFGFETGSFPGSVVVDIGAGKQGRVADTLGVADRAVASALAFVAAQTLELAYACDCAQCRSHLQLSSRE